MRVQALQLMHWEMKVNLKNLRSKLAVSRGLLMLMFLESLRVLQMLPRSQSIRILQMMITRRHQIKGVGCRGFLGRISPEEDLVLGGRNPQWGRGMQRISLENRVIRVRLCVRVSGCQRNVQLMPLMTMMLMMRSDT
uniref:Uncharacterized protein n=1 Tax=Opuntia streptacantha TaxID=393608 RepID=A0A7C9ANW3_OPUST